MRKIMLLMVVLLFILTGCSQKEESVPTFVMTEYNQEFMKDGVVTGTDCYTYSYNEDGLAIYRERYQDGSLFSCTSWEYDDYGVLRKEESLFADGDNSVAKYDEWGAILTSERYENGRKCIVEFLDAGGYEYVITYYDEAGNVISEEEYYRLGEAK